MNISPVGRFVESVVTLIVRAFRRLFVFESQPGSAAESGYAPFTALATFALSQSVALTAVARGRGRDGVVLTIYAITTFATVLWIWSMLCSVRRTEAATEAFFDAPTMRFGRVTLAWTIVLGIVLLGLGAAELLPNQTHKEVYSDRITKKCIGRVTLGDPQTLDSRLDQLPLLAWFPQAGDPNERFAVMQQVDPFEKSYFDFSLELHCKQPYAFARRAAFLMNGEGPLNLRPLTFLEPGANPRSITTIAVQGAEPNDRIVVMAYLQNTQTPGVFDKAFDRYEVRLVPASAQQP